MLLLMKCESIDKIIYFVYLFQILFNKAVLDQLKFPYPMFLTTWHMLLATFLTQIMSRTTNMLPGVKEVSEFYAAYRCPEQNNICVTDTGKSG